MTILHPRQYQHNTNLTEITLNDTIQTIPRECFQGCIKLKKIIIPRSVKRIDFKAFANSGLEEIIFEENSSLRVLSSKCFEMCVNLTSISLPPSLLIIGSSSFQHCLMLKMTISLPLILREVGALAFAQSGIENLNILTLDITSTSASASASTITSKYQERHIILNIGYASFQKCLNLHSLNISSHNNLLIDVPSSISPSHSSPSSPPSSSASTTNSTNYKILNIGRYVFSDCTNLTSLTIPSSVLSIGQYAFESSGLKSVTFSSNSPLETISKSMFSYCNHLINISTPPSIKTIGEYGFYGCGINDKSFTHIFTNSRIKHIQPHAFAFCKNLTSIKIPSFVRLIGKSAFEATYLTQVQFSLNSEIQIIPCSLFSRCTQLQSITTFPPSVKSISRYAFYESGIEDTAFATIFANGTIKHIGEYAFGQCNNLTSIIIPSSIISIKMSAFGNTSLEKVEFSQECQLAILSESIFAYCANLKVITLPPSITSIGTAAFFRSGINSESVRNIFINCNIKHIGENAFFHCKSITSITIPSSVTSIDKCAFQHSSLKYIEFAEDSILESIPDYIFANCNKLTTVTLSPSIKSIGDYAFYQSHITDGTFAHIFVNNHIRHIGMRAFSGCDHLKHITIPSSVTSVDDYAFFVCYSLVSVTFNNNSRLKCIPEGMFYDCFFLKDVKLPPSINSIGKRAFYQSGIDRKSVIHIFSACKIEHVGKQAFSKCAFKPITIPSSVTSIDTDAFDFKISKRSSHSNCVIN